MSKTFNLLKLLVAVENFDSEACTRKTRTQFPVTALGCPRRRLSLLTSEGGSKGVTFVYLNMVICWTRLTRQTSQWIDSLYYTTIRTLCLYMKRHDFGQYLTELLMTSLVCKVGFYYSSASVNQLFNIKNSFLQLLSRKATLKCEVLFKLVFFTNFFT